MSICIFPGTFNPIHEGHLKMAQYALDNYKFDKILFIPSYLPPHKEINNNLAKHRFKMVELAIGVNPKFEVSDVEYSCEGKSYSLITVKKVIEQYGIKGRLNFIIGTDAFEKLDTWYHADELKGLVHFIVFPRRGDNMNYEGFRQSGWDFEITGMEYVDISSTEIRKGIKIGETKEVEEYIEKYGLYKD